MLLRSLSEALGWKVSPYSVVAATHTHNLCPKMVKDTTRFHGSEVPAFSLSTPFDKKPHRLELDFASPGVAEFVRLIPSPLSL
jgi:hypothetical protein